MEAEDAIELYSLFLEHGVQVWINGGWGIDALLERQTRPHKDLDVLVRFEDVATIATILADRGYVLKEIWSENRWVSYADPVKLIGREQGNSTEIATAFVLWHPNGLELDVHALLFDDGNCAAAWDEEFFYPAEIFEGHGKILTAPVRCLSAQMQMAAHSGYKLLDKDLQDVRNLHERFGVAYLEEQAPFFR